MLGIGAYGDLQMEIAPSFRLAGAQGSGCRLTA